MSITLGDISSSERRFDLIVFGAGGFTGQLTAAYLAEHASPGTRWALAGRDRAKLEQVRAQLAVRNPLCAELPLLYADASDADSIGALAGATRVMISTIGPYVLHGEPLVAACAAAGTDYVDLTGEQEFVDRMYVGYHERALASGSRLVHCCGFEAIAHDLGAFFTVKHLPGGVPIRLRAMLRLGFPRSPNPADMFSSGSLHSALLMASRGRERAAAAAARGIAESASDVRASRLRPLPRYQRASGSWTIGMRSVATSTVTRSAEALGYGPDFTHAEYLAVRRLSSAVMFSAQAGAFYLLARMPATRSLLIGRIGKGRGPSPQKLRLRSFTLALSADGGGVHVDAEVAGGDPGYFESSKMLAESALCLAHDKLPAHAGQLTPALAMGDALLARLQRSGIRFSLPHTGATQTGS